MYLAVTLRCKLTDCWRELRRVSGSFSIRSALFDHQSLIPGGARSAASCSLLPFGINYFLFLFEAIGHDRRYGATEGADKKCKIEGKIGGKLEGGLDGKEENGKKVIERLGWEEAIIKTWARCLWDYEIECGVSHVERVMMRCYWDGGDRTSEANPTMALKVPSKSPPSPLKKMFTSR